jgi:Rrf2 family transcriptional regulator, iron-sulfur cluster assembly transcription factor
MKVSAQEEYGLRCLLQLARLAEGHYLTLNEMAKLEGISVANAGKLLWLLSKAGLVRSIRGTKGGYQLARPAKEIRLSEVIKILDEEGLQGHCNSYTGLLDACIHTGDCGIRPVIVSLHEIVNNALSGITLAHLIGNEEGVGEMLYQIKGISRLTQGTIQN